MIHRILAEDIMNRHVPQGTHLETALLAHMPMDLYTPARQAGQDKPETLRASPQAPAHRRR
jgi:hypothetical protein